MDRIKRKGTADDDVAYEPQEESEGEHREAGKRSKKEKKLYVGTILYDDHGFRRKCFTEEDVALLSCRKEFEVLINFYFLCKLTATYILKMLPIFRF